MNTPDDITLGDLIDIEEATGLPLDQLNETSKAKAITAVAWILKRREDPAFTFDDARRLTVADLSALGLTPGETGSPGEAPGGANGLSPPASPAPGPSTLSPL